jgi:AcrR family transcriptional regulator
MALIEVRPRKKAIQKRSQETVRAILDATAHIIEADDMENLNTNTVALEAGVSIGSLYQYFPSKESILAELVNRELKVNLDKICSTIEEIPTDNGVEEFITQLVDTISELFKKKRKLRLMLFRRLPRGLMKGIHEIENEFQNIVYNKLKIFDLIYTDDELKLKSFVLIHSFVGVMMGTLAHGRKYDEKAIKNELKGLALKTIQED